jgi:DNA-binding transcriptional regulator YiaG
MSKADNLYHDLISKQPTPEKVMALVVDAGATQSEAAAALHISYATLRSWLSGRTKVPSPIWLLLQKVGLPALIAEYREECSKIKKAAGATM